MKRASNRRTPRDGKIRGKLSDERYSTRKARAVTLLDDINRWFDPVLALREVGRDRGDAVRAELLVGADLLRQ
jgi:hypothetical protein